MTVPEFILQCSFGERSLNLSTKHDSYNSSVTAFKVVVSNFFRIYEWFQMLANFEYWKSDTFKKVVFFRIE